MNRNGAQFAAAVKMDEMVEKATGDFMDSALNLAKELTERDFATLTENEKKFVGGFGKFALLGMLTSKIGG